ncbi:MAG: polysaccharide deacetylase family protein [Desulfurococcales archaeon]|nr:polysaccharide deacetylase family protein [Desulfurococcales archaeon]
MTVYLSFDVEPDAPPYQSHSDKASLEGLKWILETLDEARVKATFFVVGKLAERHPWVPEAILEGGHELASHGYRHLRLDRVPLEKAEEDIRRGIRVLREYTNIISFRAPNLQLPLPLLPVLKEEECLIDSSIATYKGATWKVWREDSLIRVPVTATSSLIRILPRFLWKRFLLPSGKLFYSIFYHPWEFERIRRVPFWRPDIWLGTGIGARMNFRTLLGILSRKDMLLCPIRGVLYSSDCGKPKTM